MGLQRRTGAGGEKPLVEQRSQGGGADAGGGAAEQLTAGQKKLMFKVQVHLHCLSWKVPTFRAVRDE